MVYNIRENKIQVYAIRQTWIVPRDQVFPLIVVDSLLLQLKHK